MPQVGRRSIRLLRDAVLSHLRVSRKCQKLSKAKRPQGMVPLHGGFRQVCEEAARGACGATLMVATHARPPGGPPGGGGAAVVSCSSNRKGSFTRSCHRSFLSAGCGSLTMANMSSVILDVSPKKGRGSGGAWELSASAPRPPPDCPVQTGSTCCPNKGNLDLQQRLILITWCDFIVRNSIGLCELT